MITVSNATQEDFKKICCNIRKVDKAFVLEDEGDFRIDEALVCFTLSVNGKPAAIFGATRMADHVAHVRAVITDDMRGHGVAMTRFIRYMFKHASEHFHIHRTFTWVIGGCSENARWLNFFDFQRATEHDCTDDEGNSYEGYIR